MSNTTDTSVIFQDVKDIIKTPDCPYSPEFNCEVKLHTEDKDLDNRDGVVISGLHILRDYVNNMADYIEINLSCMLGTYVYDIYPYLDNIELTIYTIRQHKPKGVEVFVPERYKAIFLLERNSNLPSITQAPRENLNQELPINLTLQLLDRSAETVRIKTVQGSFDSAVNTGNTDMSVGAFLKSIISSQVGKISIESRPAIDRVEIEKPHNTGSLKSVTIPSGTRLVEVPEYIQNKSEGIYTSGVGNYVQRFASKVDEWFKVFFVYSLYDASKYHKSPVKVIFYSPPTSVYSTGGQSFTYKDGVLKVLVNTTTSFHDTKDSIVMSSGGGFRSSNANSMMKKPVEITENGPEFKRSGSVTEVVHKQRPDGLNFAPIKKVSSNHFAASSEVLSKVGKYVKLHAYNLDLDYFQPGSACKIVYEGKDQTVEELYGVIHRIRATLQHPSLDLISTFKKPQVLLNSTVEFEIYVTE